jgi:hypothetical protein
VGHVDGRYLEVVYLELPEHPFQRERVPQHLALLPVVPALGESARVTDNADVLTADQEKLSDDEKLASATDLLMGEQHRIAKDIIVSRVSKNPPA